jgi:hypothetical protein
MKPTKIENISKKSFKMLFLYGFEFEIPALRKSIEIMRRKNAFLSFEIEILYQIEDESYG